MEINMNYELLRMRIMKIERNGGKVSPHAKQKLRELRTTQRQAQYRRARYDKQAMLDADPTFIRRTQIRHIGGAWVVVRVNYEKGSVDAPVDQGYNLRERRWARTNTPLCAADKASALKLIDKLRAMLVSSDPHELTPDGEITE
jgi:hypothetical protein